MDFHDFTIFTELEKLDAVLRYGHLLTQSTEMDNRIFLFEVNNFYVIFRFTVKDDQLIDIRVFREIDQALPKLRKPTNIADPACRVMEIGDR